MTTDWAMQLFLSLTDSDFRRVYASLLEQWLGSDASEVIPGLGRLQLTA